MPFRTAHNCILFEGVGPAEKVQKIQTPYGIVKIILGRNLDGVLAPRSMQIPATIPINYALEMCRLRRGRFSPATPMQARNLMSEGTPFYIGPKCLPEHREILKGLISDFEIEVDETTDMKLSVWSTAYINSLPDSAFIVVLPDGRRFLPYKDKTGKIDVAHVRNALARVNQMAVKAGVMKEALLKLLRIAKALGIKVQDKSKFRLSDLEFYLEILSELEEE